VLPTSPLRIAKFQPYYQPGLSGRQPCFSLATSLAQAEMRFSSARCLPPPLRISSHLLSLAFCMDFQVLSRHPRRSMRSFWVHEELD
jgi:hypothetical protein